MIYLNFALIITRKKMAIFLNILIDALQQKGLMLEGAYGRRNF
jgi:hypothetical protein